jgi:hypothetical protein
MKKSNRQREMLLQKKRTKRNQSRKGKTYNPFKFKEPANKTQDKDVIAL